MTFRVRAWVVGLGMLACGAASTTAFVAPVPAVQARTTISGSVVDAALTPLAGVAVMLEQNGRVIAKATTDAAGKFTFDALGAGAYRVRVEHTGFPLFTKDIVIPANTAAMRLPIVLVRPEDRRADKAEASPVAGRAQPTVAPPVGGAGGTAMGQARGGGAGSGAVGAGAGGGGGRGFVGGVAPPAYTPAPPPYYRFPESGETYSQFEPNRFHRTMDKPLSTFGADVDTASYANIRRFLSSGQLPPSDAVRIEELVNYFHFNYAQPRDGQPIAVTTEIGDCPWAPSHKLVLIGARAAAPAAREITGRNIVLLIDVSGSMGPPERLPMIKTALGLFIDTLRPDDSIAIVTYAGTSGVALEPTPARRRDTIQRAISGLNAGGSTNGGSGLILAYRIAREAFMPGGVNRVILATDGDFNVGVTSQRDLLNLIERERESGVFLSVFGVGSGNLKDATMEMLADRGNGNYSYLDSLQEARRVLIREGDATLEAVAKDVKFQVEFNPAAVSAWKLLGYENRALAPQDFNNDRKDAGEMGAGHTVTVLYEVAPAGIDERVDDRDGRPSVDPLRYQAQAQPAADRPAARPTPPNLGGEWFTVKVRYKMPESDTSQLITVPVRAMTLARPQFLPLASAIAEFGVILRDDARNGERWRALERRVSTLVVPAALTADFNGFRELVATAQGLSRIR